MSLSAQHIAIRRLDERVGEIVVHFPRAGFLVLESRLKAIRLAGTIGRG